MNKALLKINESGLYLNDKPFYLASGDMHYFRFFKDGWKGRLQLMKDFGLTAVQTYVPWNMHEPKPGVYNFEGHYDLILLDIMMPNTSVYSILFSLFFTRLPFSRLYTFLYANITILLIF